MRLIDADTLIKDLSYLYTKNHIPVDMRVKGVLTTIMEQPTAYDVDKVVEQLEELRKECEDPLQDYDPNYFIDKAIEIVKAGEKIDD